MNLLSNWDFWNNNSNNNVNSVYSALNAIPGTNSLGSVYSAASAVPGLSASSGSGGLLSNLSSLWDGANSIANSLGGWTNALQGLGSLYSMWNGFNLAQDQLDLARDQFNFGRNYSTAQLNNNIDAYNTALADRARTRAFTETGNENAYNDWYEKNKLSSFKG